MASPRPPSLAQAHHYRLPELLHDIRLLDLLLLSQPTISRRYRLLKEDFGLVRDHPLLAGCPWPLPTPQRFRAAANWLELLPLGALPPRQADPKGASPRRASGGGAGARSRRGARPEAAPARAGPPCSAGPWAWVPRLPVHTVRELGRMGGSQQLEG